MLGKSCNQLPYNIVFVLDDEGCPDEVIGHSWLCRVHAQETSCFVESVVIKKMHRGKGYGGKLMRETEEHARKLGFEVAYLTTHDKVDFYRHVGYTFCQPVVSLGSASTLLSDKMLNKLFGKMSTPANEECHSKKVARVKTSSTQGKEVHLKTSSLVAFPPPPPLPSTMPPPPPLPAPVVMSTAISEANDDPHSPRSGDIHWMKKSLVVPS